MIRLRFSLKLTRENSQNNYGCRIQKHVKNNGEANSKKLSVFAHERKSINAIENEQRILYLKKNITAVPKKTVDCFF